MRNPAPSDNCIEFLMIKIYSVFLAIASLWLATIACRPVIAIGWPEFVILVIVIAILLGPVMLRIYRFLDRLQKASKEEKKNREP